MLTNNLAYRYATNLLRRHCLDPRTRELGPVFDLPGNNLEVLARWILDEARAEQLTAGPRLQAFISRHFSYVMLGMIENATA